MELLFVLSANPTGDLDRLSTILKHSAPRLERVRIAAFALGPSEELRHELEKAKLPYEVLTADSEVAAVNRGLLLRTGDVYLVAGGLLDVPGTLAALMSVLQSNDRVGAVVPSLDEGDATDAERERWVSQCALPEAAQVPGPDLQAVLLRHTVMNMAGTLSESFGSLGEALTDWCLRALRLGFVTSRANRALVRRTPGAGPLHLADSRALLDRHPYYAALRRSYDEDFSARMTGHALAHHRGTTSVCLDLRYLPEGAINGTGVYAVELCRALRKHTRARLSLCVATEGQKSALAPLELPVFLGDSPPADVQLIHRPAQVFLKENLALLLRSRAAFVITFQDLIAWKAASAFQSGEHHAQYRLVSYLAVRSAQAIVAISEHNRQEIIREFQVAPERVHTVHHGVDPKAFARGEEGSAAATLAPLNLSDRFFLFIGSDYAHKNIRLLLASYARFRSSWKGPGPAPGLVMVGHPSGTLDGLYSQLKEVPQGLHYLGGVSHEVLRALYHQAIALVYLSAYEGFGLPLLEAMAAQTPILCSDLTSIPEVAGDAALYVREMSDEEASLRMAELASTPGLRQDLTEKGKQRVAQFTWEQTARKTFAAYQAAIERPSPESLFDRGMLMRLAATF